MFGSRYFGDRYFGPRYFGAEGADAAEYTIKQSAGISTVLTLQAGDYVEVFVKRYDGTGIYLLPGASGVVLERLS